MILHIDMDAFYASVEERDQPQVKGRPMIVGGSPQGRGVVAAANYAARRYGVHSAMPAAQALRLCPHLLVLPARHEHYAAVSQQIRAIFERYTPLVEPLSLDEAFLDVTGSRRLFGPATEIGRRIQSEIHDELDLSASVGIAANKFLAKIASDLRKPGGFVVVDSEAIQDFLDPLPVERLWGVGRTGRQTLQAMGVNLIGELRRLPAEALKQSFGKWGEQLSRLARGVDDRAVVPDCQAKSISHETTFEVDIRDPELLRAWLLELCTQVARRLRHSGLRGRTIQIKLRFANFRTITRARTLDRPTDLTQTLWQTGAELLQHNLPRHHSGIRLLGFGVSGLSDEPTHQADLFGDPSRERLKRLDAVSDRVHRRFGDGALRRGTALKREG
jgi:DNA polymerase-4